MKTDLTKLLVFIWLCFTAYIVFEIFLDIHYITDMIEAYMQMVVQNLRK
jgi:hypothetical protein